MTAALGGVTVEVSSACARATATAGAIVGWVSSLQPTDPTPVGVSELVTALLAAAAGAFSGLLGGLFVGYVAARLGVSMARRRPATARTALQCAILAGTIALILGALTIGVNDARGWQAFPVVVVTTAVCAAATRRALLRTVEPSTTHHPV